MFIYLCCFWWYHRQWLVCRIFTSYETTNYPRHSTHRFQELLNIHIDYYLLLLVLTVVSNNSLLLYCYFTNCPHPCNQVLDGIVMQRFCNCWFKTVLYIQGINAAGNNSKHVSLADNSEKCSNKWFLSPRAFLVKTAIFSCLTVEIVKLNFKKSIYFSSKQESLNEIDVRNNIDRFETVFNM